MSLEDSPIKIKVVLLGNASVGKTSIILRFTEDKFEPYEIPTLAVSNCKKDYEINKKVISYEIWDTAGQERYRGLVKNFYRNSDVGILVYDITRAETFNDLKNYWYKELIDNSSGDISILL